MEFKSTLFGSAYYDEYMPYDRIDTDFQMMKDAGFNVIRIAESTWSTWEPSDNQYDFTHLHRMLDKATEYGISVIIGTPTYAIPPWLYKKYSDIMAVTAEGPLLYGHRQLHDITNPHFLFHAERIIRKLMDEVKDYDCVIGYQLDNETRAADAASSETQKLFVAELRKTYPDINEFNREFGLDYWSNKIDSWDDFPDIRGTINGSLSAAYKRFLRNRITEYLTWQASIIREYKRDDQFITHNFDYSWIGHSFGIQPLVNQFDAAKCMDIAGVDIYHPCKDELTGATIAFGGAVGRALKKDNYLVLETEAQGRTDWLAYKGQLRLNAYSHLASGALSVMYWHWHSIHNSFETYWKGILSHDLKANATYNELSDFRHEMLSIEDRIRGLKKESKVAIIVDNQSLVGIDEFPISDSSELDYNHILRWFYDSCYEMNIECDLVSVEDTFDNYQMLIVPALYSASVSTLNKIKDYISNGGHALIGFKSGFSDEEIKVYAGTEPYVISEAISAHYDQYTNPKGVSITIDDKHYEVTEWMELLYNDDAKVIASYDHKYYKDYAAITCKDYGKGSATYIGCYFSKEGLKSVISSVTKKAGINIPKIDYPIVKKSGINQYGRRINYYFNYSSDEQSFVYDGRDGISLLDNSDIYSKDTVKLNDWDLIIIEENEE